MWKNGLKEGCIDGKKEVDKNEINVGVVDVCLSQQGERKNMLVCPPRNKEGEAI